MEANEEKLYVEEIFYIIGIIAATMVCLWIGYKMYLIFSEKLHKSKKNDNQSCHTELVQERSYKNEMTQTSNDDSDQKKVVYRSHRKDTILRCSESGLFEIIDLKPYCVVRTFTSHSLNIH